MENYELARTASNLILDGAPRTQVEITQAAAEHVVAWDIDQKAKAIHEAGHAVVAAVLGMTVKAVDISSRDGGHTELGTSDDNLPETTTGQDLLNQMTMILAAAAAERLIIGHGTLGSADDLRRATLLAYQRLSAGLDPDVPYIAPDGIPFGLFPESLGAEFFRAASATLGDCRDRADALVATHETTILSFAATLYARRRLAGAELEEALSAAVARAD